MKNTDVSLSPRRPSYDPRYVVTVVNALHLFLTSAVRITFAP